MALKEFARKVFAGQWPILVVGVILLAALGLVITGYWRRGALVGERQPQGGRHPDGDSDDERAGLLVIRSRTTDFVTTATVSATMLYIAWTIDPLGTS